MKLLKSKLVKRIASILIVCIVGYFFYASLSRNWEDVQEIEFSFNIVSVFAIFLFALAVVYSGLLWKKMLNYLTVKQGQKVSNLEAIRIQVSSWLLKYIPGQAGSMLNKVVWAKNKGYNKKLVLITFIYENIFLLVASFIISLPILLVAGGNGTFENNPVYILISIGIILVALVTTNSKTMHWIMNLIFSKIIKQPVGKDSFLSNKQSFLLLLHYIIPRVINAVGFVLVVVSFLGVDSSSYIPLGAVYTLAGAVGILAIFVPSGIGVREATIVLFASPFIGPEKAIIAAIVARLYSTIADGLLAVGYVLLNAKKGRVS